MSLLILPASTGAATAAVASAALPLKRKVEAVGRAFQATKHAAPKPSAVDEVVEESKIGVQIRDPKYDRYKKFDIDLNDYYTLMGLEERMFDATKDEITERYRELCKVIHPDKAAHEDRAKAEERYKALQVGWETLTDAARRKGYDSSLEFDDAIPKETQGNTEKTFFSVYGPVFDSNSRYSTIRPVPRLGSLETPDSEVVDFYDFWNNFNSWREFPELNKNSLESTSCRQQKREYQRENEKAQASRRKEELARVRKLTENANKRDPRMIRMRAVADEAKNGAKRKREEELKQKEIDAKQKIVDEAARVEREKQNKIREAEDKKNFKEVQKKTRAAFGKACKAAGLPDDKTDALRATLELEQMQEINEAFTKDAKSAHGAELFNAYVARAAEAEAAKKAMSADQLKEAASKQKALDEECAKNEAREWSNEEDSALGKAVGKFPAGTLLRWEKITDEFVFTTNSRRDIKAVIRRAKNLEHDMLGSKHIGSQDAFAAHLAKMNAKATRDEVSKTQNMGEAAAASSAAPAAAAAVKKTSAPSTPELKATAVPFTAAEQQLFEAALKSVGKDAADRWEQIAAKVKTKTKAECIARFKAIKAEIEAQKAKK